MDVIWKRSSRCASNACVEVAHGPGRVLVRDSDRVDSPVLVFSAEDWALVLSDTACGIVPLGFDHTTGVWEWTSIDTGTDTPARLQFTRQAWVQFRQGVEAGEFRPEVAA